MAFSNGSKFSVMNFNFSSMVLPMSVTTLFKSVLIEEMPESRLATMLLEFSSCFEYMVSTF